MITLATSDGATFTGRTFTDVIAQIGDGAPFAPAGTRALVAWIAGNVARATGRPVLLPGPAVTDEACARALFTELAARGLVEINLGD